MHLSPGIWLWRKLVASHDNGFSSVQFSRSVMSNSLRPHESQHARPPCPSPTPGIIQTHVHQVGDAIQLSHPLSSPSLPAANPSQHQGLFQWVNSLHEVARVLEFQLQHQSFQWTPRTDDNGLMLTKKAISYYLPLYQFSAKWFDLCKDLEGRLFRFVGDMKLERDG